MRRLAVLLTIAALCESAPALAQRKVEPVTGSSIPVPAAARVRDDGGNPNRARIVMADFARCTIDQSPRQVAAWLQMPLGPEYSRALTKMVGPDCLWDGELRFKAIIIRGAMFTELWRRRVIAESRGKPWGPVLPAYVFADVPMDASPAIKQQAALLWLGDCIVKRDRAAASEVLLQPIGSKAQRQAYTRLNPNLGPCLPEGMKLTFSKSILEGALAEALYRAPTAEVKE